MSTIAKLIIRNVTQFGSGNLIEMSCICDNDLMTAYATSHEDKLFTKYSPWGEIKVHQPSGYQLGEQGDAFYIMIVRKDEVEQSTFPKSVAFAPLRVVSTTDFGDNMAKRLEMNEGYDKHVSKTISSFNWKMSVDNPHVTNSLKPGSNADYQLIIYPAALGRDEVIRLVHANLT